MPKPIFLFSLDKGYTTLAGEDGITACVILEEDRKRPKAYREFRERFDKLTRGEEKYKWPDGREETYQTIAVDPMTCLSTMIFNHYQFINNNVDKKASFTEYQFVKSTTEDILDKAIRCSQYVCVTAMLMVEKDELTGEIFFLSDMIGKVREEMGMWFDAVFYMTNDKAMDGQVKYQALTVGSRRHRAKLRVPSSLNAGILASEVPDFRVIASKISSAHKKREV